MPADDRTDRPRCPDPDDRAAAEPTDQPWTIRAAAALAIAEAAGTGAFAVRFVVDVLPLGEPRLMRAGFALGVVTLVVGGAALLVVAARALLRARPWSRSFLLVAQVMALAIGVPMLRGGDWVGWAVAAIGALTIVLLLHPATTAALDRAERRL